jgi:hypothetical protein
VREEGVVVVALLAAGLVALIAFNLFQLGVLALFAVTAGAATEFGRLAFQSLMQRSAPRGSQGRVFVRYEVLFQLAWVVGAFIPAVSGMSFRTGVIVMTVFYLGVGVTYLVRPFLPKREPAAGT